MTPDDLVAAWSRVPLPTVHGDLSGLRVSGTPPDAPIWIARDAAARWHLLVEVTEGTEPVRQRTTRGFEVTTQKLRVATAPPATYIDLICLDVAHQPTFAAVTSDVIAAASAAISDRRGAVLRTLNRWRSFWSVDADALSREAALGLFGELWFLSRWMGPVGAPTLARWQGPAGARHDFQWAAASVEAKATTASSGGAVHWIASLDQLESPATGRLYLFSLQVVDDVLASNTLPGLAGRITESLATDPDATFLFSERLAQAGYNPAHAHRYTRPLRVVAEELYRVEGDFPRLTRSTFAGGLPAGIDGVSYCLSLSACAAWRIAISPLDPGIDFLRAGT